MSLRKTFNRVKAAFHNLSGTPASVFRPSTEERSQNAPLDEGHSQAHVHALVWEQMVSDPTAIAIVSGHTKISYGELRLRVSALSAAITAQGIVEGSPVLVLIGRSAEAVVAILAVLTAGNSYIPIDSAYPQERIDEILEDSRSTLLLTTSKCQFAVKSPVLRIDVDEICANLSDCQPAPVAAKVSRDPACILYTSGSTGKPKGVVISHGNLANYYFAWTQIAHIDESRPTIGQIAFFSFAVFQGDWIRALCSGGRLVFLPSSGPSRELYGALRSHRVGFIEFVPPLLRALLDYVEREGVALDFLKYLVVGADRWYVHEHNRARQLCGSSVKVLHVYGSSETTFDSTVFEESSVALNDSALTPIGSPIPNVQAYVLDDKLSPVSPGDVGLLYIGGQGIATCYLNRPDLTREKFINALPSTPNSVRLFCTGDLASTLSDGNICFHGRADNQVKVNGFRIELGEIEIALLRCEGVMAAVAHAWDSCDGNTLLIGYVVPRTSYDVEPIRLRDALFSSLPSFMVPAMIVVLEELPLTRSGKIDRRALPAPRAAIHREFSVTCTSVSEKVLEMVRRALAKPDIASTDDLKRLGLDSMNIVDVISEVEATFEVAWPEDADLNSVFTTAHALTKFVECSLLVSQSSSLSSATH